MTEKKPLVSVIINCYNGEMYLREAIDSVIAQTYENWELVFWDNQSTDSTREIVEGYKNSKIHYFYAPKHTPLGEARNLAVEKSIGEYINFLDADDVWSPNKLEEQVKLIVPGEVEVVYTPFELLSEGHIDENMIKVFYELYLLQNKQVAGYKILLRNNFIVFSSVLMGRDLFLAIGGVNKDFQQYEDYELLLKSSFKTNFAYAKEACTRYRIHGSNSSTNNKNHGYVEFEKILRALPDSKEKNVALKKNKARLIWSQHMSAKSLMVYLISGGWYWTIVVAVEKVRRTLLFSLNRRKIEKTFSLG